MSSTTPADLDQDLRSERVHLTESRAALARMRQRAEALYSTGEQVAGDPFGAESLGRALARRIAELADDPAAPLFFGRLDFGPDYPDHALHTYHVGRRHVIDAAGEPMVLDWLAPVSRAFYRASARDPQGVAMRRRFGWGYDAGVAQLTSFEDEHLDRGEELGTASKILTSEIERPRVGPMRDIVATIQPDQDELVRAELDTSICVQGAPGTGKTAVGLHRAAYLLYAYRERLRRAGVLIIGPNSAFLRYIGAVLPALGEIDVTQATLPDLFGTVPSGTDTPGAEIVKHDVRMAKVLHNALYGRISRPETPIEVPDGSNRWRISTDALRRIVDDVRRADPPYATGRERVRARVVSLLQRQSEARRAESPSDAWLRRMGKVKQVTDFLDAAWPAATAEGVLAGLFSDAGALARAAGDLLTAPEREALRWPVPPRSARAIRWTPADAVLIDELAGLIERPASFGHIVVDEAQDLSPMQARAVARRSEHAAITLLGDLAQGTTPWAARDWRVTLAHLGKPDAAVVPLTTGFRVPAAVLTLANRLLPALDVDVFPATSLRHDGELTVESVPDAVAAMVGAVRTALDREGSIGVIVADAGAERVARALHQAGIATEAAGGPAGTGGDAAPAPAPRVSVVPATLAKGLEYDHVVLVEPADIVAAEARGLHRLYVALTRAVSGLSIVHARPLPTALA